jgi:hypothetical protein
LLDGAHYGYGFAVFGGQGITFVKADAVFTGITRHEIPLIDPHIARFVGANSVMLTDYEMLNAHAAGEAIAQVCVERKLGWIEMIMA